MTAKRESGLRTRIVKALRGRGCFPLVQHGDVYSGPGRSDLIICVRGRFVAMEVKTATGTTTRAQERFLDQVRACGGIAGVVRSVGEALHMIDLDALFKDDEVAEEPVILANVAASEPPPPDGEVLVLDEVVPPKGKKGKTTKAPETMEEKLERIFKRIDAVDAGIRAVLDTLNGALDTMQTLLDANNIEATEHELTG